MASKSSSKADDLQLQEKATSSIGADAIAVEDKCFIYDTNDLHFQFINWPPDAESFTQSKFDEILSEKWDIAMENGTFNYNLDEVRRRKINGKYEFIAQLNSKRFKERRKPQEIDSVRQPFRKDKFNFTKVKENEILFKMKSAEYKTKESKKVEENLVIVNISPIDYGHVLLVPDATALHSQALTYDAVKLSIDVCLLSTHRGLRIGFNSLCAFASVNHLHLHIIYVNYVLPIDKVSVSEICNGLYEIADYAVHGFALQIENRDIEKLARRVTAITSYLYENEIAHNLFICRQKALPLKNAQDNNDPEAESTVRVFIFPKLSAPAITEFAFNAATVELAGYLPMKDEEEFESLNEVDVIETLNKFCLREDEFADLRDAISLLLLNLRL
eukprot:gene3465-1844_t